MTIEFHATPLEVMRAVEALQEFARARKIPEPAVFGLALALEESASNIVKHAYRGDASRTFRLTLESADGALRVELRDQGPPFDPTSVSGATPKADQDDPGGWGLGLVRRNTDELHYRREAGENVLRFARLTRKKDSAVEPPSSAVHAPFAMPLEIRINQEGLAQNPPAVTVNLSGSLDTATAPELERQLPAMLATPAQQIIFDLAQLKFISSAGLRVFSSVRKQLKEKGGQAAFVNLQPQIKEVFEIIRSLPGIAVFTSLAELDAYLAARQNKHQEKA